MVFNRVTLTVMTFLISACLVAAQDIPDTLISHLPQLQLPDTLLPAYHKLDSIRHAFNNEADSLKKQYENSLDKLDQVTRGLHHTRDSLQNLRLPLDKYNHKIDSISEIRLRTTKEFNSRATALKAKTTDKLKGLDLPPQYNEPLQQITGKVDEFNLQSDIAKIPQLNVPGYSLPNVDGVGDLASQAGDLRKMRDVGNLNTLSEVETPVGNLGELGGQAKELQGDLKDISKGNLDDLKTFENQAGKIGGAGELSKATGSIDDIKSNLGNLNDPNKVKEQAVEMAKQKAVDHFAGKQEQLKAAMDKLLKYKQKYSAVSSVKDLSRRPPNAMKGKPLSQRLLPGLFFQYHQKDYNLFDFNPYLGYKLSGRLTTGLGWNQRFAYDRKNDTWQPQARVFGPRMYVDLSLRKGYIAHLESELMNAFVSSPNIQGNPEIGQREWVWGVMMGLKKEYTIYKNLRGTVLIQYNFLNPHEKAIYSDRLNSRIGFEYLLQRKQPEKAEASHP